MIDHASAAVEYLRELGCPECGGPLRTEPDAAGYLRCLDVACEGCADVEDRIEAMEESERDGWAD